MTAATAFHSVDTRAAGPVTGPVTAPGAAPRPYGHRTVTRRVRAYGRARLRPGKRRRPGRWLRPGHTSAPDTRPPRTAAS